MKNYFLFALVLLLASCGNEPETPTTPHGAPPIVETPKALKEEESSYGKRGYDENLVDDLYAELLEKSKELQNLEREMEKAGTKRAELVNDFYAYNSKSTEYYGDARSNLSGIQDTLLKLKMQEIIAQSETTYVSRTANLSAWLNRTGKKEMTMHDNYVAMKIVLTLGQIEQYQKTHKPGTKDYPVLDKDFDKVIMLLKEVNKLK